jgi:DNA polymerase-1
MALFKLPCRTTENIHNILKKTQETHKPKIKIKKGTLIEKIASISRLVEKNLGEEKNNFLLITDEDQWLDYCRQAVKDGVFAIDTETTGLDNILCDIVGLSMKSPSQKAMYIPIGHTSPITDMLLNKQIRKEKVKEGLQILVDSGADVYMHNAYFDTVLIKVQFGIWLWATFDTLIASHLLNENEQHGLKYLYGKYCSGGKKADKFAELFDGIPFNYIPPDVGFPYAAKDAEMSLALGEFFVPYLTVGTKECSDYKLERISKLFWEVEMPIQKLVCDMKVRGINFDFSTADKLKEKYTKLLIDAQHKFAKSIEPLESEIRARMEVMGDIEYPVNFNSPKQLQILIYDIMKTGVIFEKEPRGTGKHVINAVMGQKKYEGTRVREIFSALEEVKKYDKLISSFIDKLTEDAIEHRGKIHPNFNQCGTDTMRFSSSNPNAQQIPAKNKDIRNMFVAGKDRVFVFLDFSQQEMMAVASLADEKKMLESFNCGRDIYSHVASIAFNKKYEDCLEFNEDGTTNKEGKERRKHAKAICLGICYGKGVKAIAEDLNVSKEKAQEIKDSIMVAFPDLARYLKNVVEFGRKHGYVENFYGGRRRLPDLNLPEYEITQKDNILTDKQFDYYSKLYWNKMKNAWGQDEKKEIISEAERKGIMIKQNGGFIAQAERLCYNYPVQSTAAYITKRAMLNIARNEKLKELGVYILLTIHDECGMSVPKEHLQEAIPILKKEFLSGGVGIDAALRCDVEVSKCWSGEPYKI